MSRNKKPRKAYRPKPVSIDTMSLARHFAAKPSKQDREEVLGALRDAVKALREGVATEQQWSVAAGSVTVAQAIESQGIVRGLHEHITTAEQALQAIYDRALRIGGGRYIRATLYFNEIDALNEFVELHTFQFNQLGRSEILAAMDAATKHTIAQGHTATLVHDITDERIAA
jgi:hypothetical protein